MTRPPAQRPPVPPSAARRPTGRRSAARSLPRPVPRGRYRRRRLAAALIAVLLFVGLGLTTRVLLFDMGLADVEHVQVSGTVTVPVDDVLAAAAVPRGGPLAAVDTGAVAARVVRLPAVASVRVGLDWPHTVTVAVTERIPVAVTGTGSALVDGTGVVYRGAGGEGLPRLTVLTPGPDDPSTRAATAVLTALPEPVRAQVLTVAAAVGVPGAPAQVTLGLTEDRQVRWGSADAAADKAAVLGPLLSEPGRVYDVTSPGLPTIRR